MYNYTNTAIALLVRMKLLTEDAGRYLSEELQSKIHNTKYSDSYAMVDELLNHLEEKEKKVTVEPWMAYIRKLEAKVEELDRALQTKK